MDLGLTLSEGNILLGVDWWGAAAPGECTDRPEVGVAVARDNKVSPGVTRPLVDWWPTRLA